MQKEIADLEPRMAQLQAAKLSLEQRLSGLSDRASLESLGREHQGLCQQLEELEARWLSLSEWLEAQSS